ncbi:hypothetical protein N9L10_02770 [Candidatus Pelagibacter bacterium]|jgi:hypothetical protein|nr:hypothetical protein [Candidatus Pelagibacter bacterium]
MKKFLILFFLLPILNGCISLPPATNVEGASTISGVEKVYVDSKSSEQIRVYYSACAFCFGYAEIAQEVAEKHCSNFNKKARFDYREELSFDNIDQYNCVGVLKVKSFEEKKSDATKQCLDIGFKEGTENFSNCVLRLVAADS